VAKAIEWERTTPREQVIARFTSIIKQRGRNEKTDNLKYWKSVAVTDRGLITDADFTRWGAWLEQKGFLGGKKLNPASYYTNELNGLATAG
jgi:hypothetical protein